MLVSNSVRMHHFLPRVALGFSTGGTAILRNCRGITRWLNVPFAVGVALTTVELLLLAGRSNPYWGGESFVAAQAARPGRRTSDVADRVVALRGPAPRLALWRVALLLGLLAATVVAVAEAMHDTERLFELAQSAYRTRPH